MNIQLKKKAHTTKERSVLPLFKNNNCQTLLGACFMPGPILSKGTVTMSKIDLDSALGQPTI